MKIKNYSIIKHFKYNPELCNFEKILAKYAKISFCHPPKIQKNWNKTYKSIFYLQTLKYFCFILYKTCFGVWIVFTICMPLIYETSTHIPYPLPSLIKPICYFHSLIIPFTTFPFICYKHYYKISILRLIRSYYLILYYFLF